MHIYLPIADISVNFFVLFGIGAAVGILSGMFGVGGGFLITPLLIFIGVPATVAVATGANQIVGSSVSGVIAQWRRKNVDVKMGTLLLVGGVLGSVVGVQLVKLLRQLGQIDLTISIFYVVFLGVIGVLMLIESIMAIRRASGKSGKSTRRRSQHYWIHGLPLKMRFPRSKLYISAIPPFIIGSLVGVLAAIMGVGGGFIMVPAMIYLLRMPTQVVIGTSLFQIIFVAGVTTILQATTNHAVDVILAIILMLGGVIGAQIGASAGQKLKGEQLRALLALLVLAVSVRMLIDLFAPPSDVYSLGPLIAASHAGS